VHKKCRMYNNIPNVCQTYLLLVKGNIVASCFDSTGIFNKLATYSITWSSIREKVTDSMCGVQASV